MDEKEFDQLTPEEKKARFQKALDDYNSGFVEVDYALRSVASIHVEEALEDAGRGLEEFKPAQRRVLFEAAKADLNLEHYMNPKFSASHMKFIMEQEMAGKDVTWLPIGKILRRSIVDKPLTRDQIRRIKERMQRAEPKDSVIADLHEKKKEAALVPKKQGQQKEKGERYYGKKKQRSWVYERFAEDFQTWEDNYKRVFAGQAQEHEKQGVHNEHTCWERSG